MRKTQYFRCKKCKGVVRFDGNFCENCGADIGYKQLILNEKLNPSNKPSYNETEVEYRTLCHEVELNRKETMIIFKRLVDVELRLEAIENKLRD